MNFLFGLKTKTMQFFESEGGRGGGGGRGAGSQRAAERGVLTGRGGSRGGRASTRNTGN